MDRAQDQNYEDSRPSGPNIEVRGSGCETVRDDAEFVLSRSSTGGGSGFLMLATASDAPAFASVRRLEHELSLRNVLDSAWAAKPIALIAHEGRPTLRLEDPGGQLLSTLTGAPWSVASFLRVAIGLVSALGQAHECGLVHKDIKPANVLVDPATGKAWLTGFGIATQLPRERRGPEPPQVIAGTLPYMAPEQTGRMNRSVDSRSDLYSLGVTFYQLLTGELPFNASEPMEWIHCHIARAAPRVDRRNTEAPEALVALVARLLAKPAEHRYQTAAGVVADLRRCLHALETTGRIEPFELGTADVSARLVVPETLYGREREVGRLVAAFDRVRADGAARLVLVSGYSGIGKSSVVHELHKALVPQRGLFAAGKFDQYNRETPFATLAKALQSLVRMILVQSETDLKRWRDAITDAVGTKSRLVVNVIPELALIIGEQAPLPELSAQEAQNQFRMILRRFIGVFASAEHPLVLFLDDLQWLDAPTLGLLPGLLTDPDLHHLLLIGAYRDIEVHADHPLLRTIGAIRDAGVGVDDLVLVPLRLDDLSRLVADTTRAGKEDSVALAQLLLEKTGGNPFFAIQFITALNEEGLLHFDPASRSWRWDLARLRAKGFTENVVVTMIDRVGRLPIATQSILKTLACLGSRADTSSLAIAHEASSAEAHAFLWEAVRMGLILREEDAYAFLHDRVQEAAYALIPEDSRAATHLRIGRRLATSMSVGTLDEAVFEIVNHLNRGSALVDSTDEREHIAELNLLAGKRAKASTACGSAATYFATALAMLPNDTWERRPALAFELSILRSECEFAAGQVAVARELLDSLLECAPSKIDRASVYRLKIDIHVVSSEHDDAVRCAIDCLRMFDIILTPHPSHGELEGAYESIWNKLSDRSIESLVGLPRLTNPELEAAMSVLAALFAPAAFTDETLSCLHICQMVVLTLDHGVTAASTFAFGWFGVLLGHYYHRYDDGYQFGQLARALVKRYGFAAFEAKTLYTLELVSIWRRPLSSALEAIRGAFVAGVESGDVTVTCYACNHIVSDMLAQGEHLDDVWRESVRGKTFAEQAQFRDVADIIVGAQRFIETMRGRTASLATFDGEGFCEAAFEAQLTSERMATMVCWYWLIKGQSRFICGHFDHAAEALSRSRALLWASGPGHVQNIDYYFFDALTAAALESVSPGDADRRARLTAHRERLERWADSCPATFLHKHVLVAAEIARLEGDRGKAMRLYEVAIQSAREHGFVQDEALANELAGRFYLAQGVDTAASAYFRNAARAYKRWGAEGKVQQLEVLYPYLRDDALTIASAPTIGAPVEHLELTTVIRVLQALTSELVLEKWIDTLLKLAVVDAGAQRGVLLVPQRDDLKPFAEATTREGGVEVQMLQGSDRPTPLPSSVLHYVARTHEIVLLDDAAEPSPFSSDPYIASAHGRSLLCLPLVKQSRLAGVLYLENNLAPSVFTPRRTAILKLLVSQAATSLENVRLYTELQVENDARKSTEDALRRSEAYLAEAQRLSLTGSFGWDVSTGALAFSDETYRLVGLERASSPALDDVISRMHPQDGPRVREIFERARSEGGDLDYEHRLVMSDGSEKFVHVLGRPVRGRTGAVEYVGAAMDITAQRQAEAALAHAQAELAHVMRVTALGELAASIAHEVNQPLAAICGDASAALNWLAAAPPAIAKAREALAFVVAESERAGEIITRIRSLLSRTPVDKGPCDVNVIVGGVLRLVRSRFERHRIDLQPALGANLPTVLGDPVQLQQVLLNLLLNAADACLGVPSERRRVVVQSAVEEKESEDWVVVSVVDAGEGLEATNAARIFDAFYTTKPDGLGMGLSICRSIMDRHDGTITATSNDGHGMTFSFALRGTT